MTVDPDAGQGTGSTAVEPGLPGPLDSTASSDPSTVAESGLAPGAGETAEPGPALTDLKALMDELLELFNARLRYDARKDEVIGKLTEHVSVLSHDARRAAATPFLRDMILLRDSLIGYRKKLSGREMWTTPDLLGPIDVILAEATEVLERQDVVEWAASGDRVVDRKFQRPVSIVATNDPAADGQVIEVIRPGYVLNGSVFRPQEVSIAKHSPDLSGSE